MRKIILLLACLAMPAQAHLTEAEIPHIEMIECLNALGQEEAKRIMQGLKRIDAENRADSLLFEEYLQEVGNPVRAWVLAEFRKCSDAWMRKIDS